jgi:hypothetical protein
MRVSLRFPEPRGLKANTEFYGFYVQAKGETRSLLEEAHKQLTEQYGSPVSNGLLLRDALRLLVGEQQKGTDKL